MNYKEKLMANANDFDSIVVEMIGEIENLNEIAKRSNKFYLDVISQIDRLCVQDYANMNELGILLAKRERK